MNTTSPQREGVHKMLDDLGKKLKEVKARSEKEHSFITDLLRYRSRGKLKQLTDDQYSWLHRIHLHHYGKPIEVNINNFLSRRPHRRPHAK